MAEHKKDKRILLSVGSVLLALLFAYTMFVSHKQYQSFLYNPESPSPMGYKALSLLLTEAGFTGADPELPEETGVYVVLTKGVNPTLRRDCLERAAAGGIIVELPVGKPMIEQDQEVKLLLGARGKECIPHLSVPVEITYHLGSNMVYCAELPETEVMSADGDCFVYSRDYGKGTILTWADPAGLTNEQLKEYPDNAVVFTLLLQKTAAGRTHLAFVDGRKVKAQAVPSSRGQESGQHGSSRWVAYLLFLLGLVLTCLKLLTLRLGWPRPLTLTENRSYDEFARSLASLFQQAQAGEIVLDNLYRALQETAREITGLPAETTQEELFGRLAEMTGADYEEAVHVHQILQQSGRSLGSGRMLEIAHKLETIRKELEEWKKSGIYSQR